MTIVDDTTTSAAERAAAVRDAVRGIGSEFEGAARQAELDRRLPQEVADRMREIGLFWMKTPLALGGSELDPIDFCDILEDVAYHDASAAWATMVGNGTTGVVAGLIPEEGLGAIYPEGEPLPILAGQLVMKGRAVPVDGGFRVTGRWSFASGIMHATWVVGGCLIEGSNEPLVACFPKEAVTVFDTWNVAGMQGTGSHDFSVEGVYVPASQTIRLGVDEPKRGGALFQQPLPIFLSNELTPVAVGIARRALDDVATSAREAPANPVGQTLRDRAAFQKSLGRCETKWRAARALYRDAVSQSWDQARSGEPFSESASAQIRASHTLSVETCVEVVAEMFRYGGGRFLSLENSMQRHYRNVIAVSQHFYVTEENFELLGAAILSSDVAR